MPDQAEAFDSESDVNDTPQLQFTKDESPASSKQKQAKYQDILKKNKLKYFNNAEKINFDLRRTKES